MQAQLCGDAQRLLNELGAVVWRMDARTLRIVQVDCGAERLGYPAEQWGAKPDFYACVLHPGDRDSTLQVVRAVASDGRGRRVRHRAIRADGGALWFRTHVLADGGPAAGDGCRLVGVMLDITELMRAEGTLRLLAGASATLAESLDYDETLARVARLAVPDLADWCMLGVVEDDVLRVAGAAHVDRSKEPLFEAMRPKSLDALGEVGRVVRSGRPLLLADVTDAMIAPGTALPVPPGEDGARVAEALRGLGVRSMILLPLQARGHALGAVVLARARPGWRYGPDDVIVAQDLAYRCAMAIDNALRYRSAQEAIQARDELLSVASHELRTPLTSMLLRLESVERKYPGLDVVVRQSKRLANLVEQLLDLSRIHLGRLELVPEPVDLGDVVRTVAARTEAELGRARCSLVVREAAKAVGTWDRLRLEQVVTNLLSNAIKFAPGTTIDVEVHADRARARLLVRDHGPGIAPQDRERIFQRFERTASHNRGGMGLGLYITRQIVQAHGGEIHVEETPGGGSTFIVELPRGAARRPSPGQARS